MTDLPRFFAQSRFTALKMIFLCLLAGLCGTAFAADWDGSTSRPAVDSIGGKAYYVITTAEELAWFAYQTNNGSRSINAILGDDIHFMEDESKTSLFQWTPIGFDDDAPFNGTLDGAGHTIYGLYSPGGLVNYTGTGFVMKNISLKRSDVYAWVRENRGVIDSCTESNDGMRQKGGLAYTNVGTIKNSASKNYGIAYSNSGTIDSCTSTGSVSSTDGIAGLVYTNSGTVKNSVSEPSSTLSFASTGSALHFGGVVAYNSGTVQNCRFRGKGTVSTSYSGTSLYAGGIAGYVSSGKITKCQSSLDTLRVTGGAFGVVEIGGVAGYVYSTSMTGSYSELNVDELAVTSGTTSNVYVGGLAGYGSSVSSLQNNHSLLKLGEGVEVPANRSLYVGGLAGYLNGSVSSQLVLAHSYGVVSSAVDKSTYRISGVSPYAAYSQVSNSYYDASVATPDTMRAIGTLTSTGSVANVSGRTTSEMKTEAFVEKLNTNSGLSSTSSGWWRYCEGRYPILTTEGTCDEFYSRYGTIGQSKTLLVSSSSTTSSSSASSSSSDVESSSSKGGSSSSTPVVSSSSSAKNSSSSKAKSSSSVKSSSSAKSSSSVKNSSSSVKSSSSSKVKSSSSKRSDFVLNQPEYSFNLMVNGMTITVVNSQGGAVSVYDMLGHRVVTKPLLGASTSITLQTPGTYMVRVNGISHSVTLK